MKSLFFAISLLVSCSQARSIAQKAEQANRYKKQAAQQIQEWAVRAAKESWTGEGIVARLETSKGTVEVRLAFQLVPLAVASFLYLASAYTAASFQRPEGAAYVQVSTAAGLEPFYAEFSEWLNFRQPGMLAFRPVQGAANIVNQAAFFISLAPQADLFGKFSAFGQVAQGLDVVRKMQTGDQIRSIQISAGSTEGQEFLEELARDGRKMLQRLAAEVLYERRGLAAIHQKLARNFAAVQWPRHQRQDLQRAGAWGLEYKVLAAGSGTVRLADSHLQQAEIQYAVWATQNDGHSLLLENRIGKSQRINPQQLFPAWRAALLDMKPGEERLYLLPPEGTYGVRGRPPDIPPWSYLVMELHLLSAF